MNSVSERQVQQTKILMKIKLFIKQRNAILVDHKRFLHINVLLQRTVISFLADRRIVNEFVLYTVFSIFIIILFKNQMHIHVFVLPISQQVFL